jgi:arginyl-tRNA synthetase
MSPITTELLSLEELADRFSAAASSVSGSQAAVVFGAPRRPEFGDVATNVAFELAKAAGRPPQELAGAVIEKALADPGVRATVEHAEPAAGFINLRLVPAYWHRTVADILERGAAFGRGDAKGKRISLEYGSANPTGPLVVVQGRTLSIGDTLARTMTFAGYDVFTEWIINDAGSQVETLGSSIYARYRQLWEPAFPFPENGYPGRHVNALAARLREQEGDRLLHVPEDEARAFAGKYGRDAIVPEQRALASKFRADFDLWQSEAELHAQGAIANGIARLTELGKTYEKDGALYIKTTEVGDDQDRVVVRSDGRPTYLANDVAYHYEKLQRADTVIDILGPDHHGYIARLNALAAAYGRPGDIEVLISQQITLRRGDEIVSMSKRAGEVVTLEDVIDEVGVDAARFFFVMLSTDQPLTFDLALAKEQSSDNPVYYVQYGHARISGVIAKALEQAPEALARSERGEHLDRLVAPQELALIRRLSEFPAVVESVAKARAPHRLPKYARDVAADFHQFYDKCKIVGDDAAVTSARLALARATRQVLASALDLCGVSAPEKM